jgi:dihydroflavonol-4-reductase
VDEVFLTGATGFVGSHVLHALRHSGYRVRALVRPGSRPLPEEPDITAVTGDLARAGELTRAMDGCRYLIHVAALYSFAPGRRRDIWTINVHGTAAILEAARIAGIERAVVTSSSATVGPASDGRLPAEESWAQDHAGVSTYHQSKLQQERAALAAQLPVVLVLPTAPVGPGDVKPTPTGKMIVDFMRGRIFASLPGGLNIVAVEDVGRAHVLALEQGRPGERYLIGGENLSLSELWQRLAAISGRPAPTRQLPYGLALAAGWADEVRCRVRPTDEPIAPLEGVWMGRQTMYVCDDKARSELGYVSRPVDEALERAIQWFRAHGYA